MGLKLGAITFDCEDAGELAAFWSAALDLPIDPGAAPHFASIGRTTPTPGEKVMMFLAVPESKTDKNRIHLDLHASDRAAEVERLRNLGATELYEKDMGHVHWTTMADPAGNEFCVAQYS